MSEYAAPSGPPPPKVPEGWKAVWNQQYSEWFYVNLHTKESTWEKPTMPAPRPGEHDDLPPGGAPPGYQAGPNAPHVSDTKKTPFDSNNPYNNNNPHGGGVGGSETDEEMARRLQREEEDRHRNQGHSPNPMSSDRGAADSYYQNTGAPSYGGAPQQPGLQGGYPGGPAPGSNMGSFSGGSSSGAKKSGGLFGKLKDKLSAPGGSGGGYSSKPGGFGGAPFMGGQQHGGYGAGGYPPQQHGYGGYPQQGYAPHGGGFMGQPARKKPGMGAGGAAALGVGGGLVGGMLLADAMDDHDYNEGYQDGMDADGGGFDGGDMGGDF